MSETSKFILVFLITNLVTLILGVVIRKYKMVDIINFYNPKKDDKDTVSELVGNNFVILALVLLIGLLLVFLDIISILIYIIFFIISTVLIIINIYSRMILYRKNR